MFYGGELKDFGKDPVVLELRNLTFANENYRTAVWTGEHLQVTVMNINPNEEIGGEIHNGLDQMIYVISGKAAVIMGENERNLSVRTYAASGDAVFIPAGTYHNLINASFIPLKVFSVYAPANHPFGTAEPQNPETETRD